MDVKRLAIEDVILIGPPRFGDDRGFFEETFNRRRYAEIGIDGDFVQDNQSLSRAVGTVRGLHYQVPPHSQAKLVRVAFGAILDVAVDIRDGSPTFGRWVSAQLSARNGAQLFVPRGFAHGFATLEPDTLVCYKVDGYYDKASERGLAFDDPDLAIDWLLPPEGATLSDKDRALPRLAELKSVFTA